jgi:acetolactate synthase I/III small subunit
MMHIVSALVENHFGVLARVSGLFSARGFNIDSLAVGETEDPSVSRMTIVVHGDERILDQIMKQLNKLIDVIKVADLSQDERIERELVLIKVTAEMPHRSDIMQVVNTFRAKIVDISPKSLAVEVTGSKGKVDAMLELLRPYGIMEVVRTGTVALSRKRELKASANSEVRKNEGAATGGKVSKKKKSKS